MKSINKPRWIIPALLFVFTLLAGLILAGCNSDPGNPFLGTWTGYGPDYLLTRVNFGESNYKVSFPEAPWLGMNVEQGTYGYSGNTATLATYSTDGTRAPGATATVSGKTMIVTDFGGGRIILNKSLNAPPGSGSGGGFFGRDGGGGGATAGSNRGPNDNNSGSGESGGEFTGGSGDNGDAGGNDAGEGGVDDAGDDGDDVQ